MKPKRLTKTEIINEIRDLANAAGRQAKELKTRDFHDWERGFYTGRKSAFLQSAKWLAYAAGLRSSLK